MEGEGCVEGSEWWGRHGALDEEEGEMCIPKGLEEEGAWWVEGGRFSIRMTQSTDSLASEARP